MIANTTALARILCLALLVGSTSNCASGEGEDFDPAGAQPDSQVRQPGPIVMVDAGAALPEASTQTDASSTANPVVDAALVDSGSSSANRDAGDAAADAAIDAATDAADVGPGDAAADVGPAPDAQQPDGGDLLNVCMGGKVGSDSTKLAAGSAYGSVEVWLPPSNEITRLQTTMLVPEEPTTRGTLFLWPGLQPLRGKDPAGIGNGVLQPVLTWGSSCAPKKPSNYSAWWISGMYVNVTTSAAGPTGCLGGDAMNVEVGDTLRMDMRLSGTKWTQSVLREADGKSVDFTVDLKGQYQNRAIFDIEEVSSTKPKEDVIFLDTVLSFAMPATSCQPSQRGPTDYFVAPQLSPDGLHCCYAKIVLRSRGVAATTPNQP